VTKRRLTLDEQMAAELAELLEEYPNIPDDAKRMGEIFAAYPSIPRKKLRTTMMEWIESGKWKRGRRKNVVYYWPA
jgi:hypothetical protein